MLIKLISASLLVIFISCNSGQNSNTSQDSSISKNIKQSPVQVDDSARKISSKKLLGIWTDGSSENATFEITKDSIYYVEQFSTYKYSLIRDSIKIFYPDWTFIGALSFIKDTMKITSDDGTSKYWKFKD